MSGPYLIPGLAISCDTNSPDSVCIAIPWNTASSDVPDWVEKVYVGRILGTVRIDGSPAQRDIVVVSAQTEGTAVLATATSSLSTGAYDISWDNYTGPVLAILLDDLGTAWTPDTQFTEGVIIYPPVWAGWQYECINPGVGPTDEPTWWTGEGVTAIIGTATFRARQYIPAQAHGPQQPIVEER